MSDADHNGAVSLRAVRAIVVLTAILGLTAAFGGGQAWAHAEIFESVPSAGSTVAAGTDEVTLRFISLDSSAPLEVKVLGPDGRNMAVGMPELTDERAVTIATVQTDPLVAGHHIITWTGLSSDGDGGAEGKFAFEVAAAPSSSGTTLWLLVGVVVVVVLGAAFLRPGRRTRTES